MPLKLIAIAGHIGAGKTELTSFLCNRSDDLYEDSISRYTMSPVLKTETLDYLTNRVDRVDLLRQIEKHL